MRTGWSALCFGIALAAGHPALAAKKCPADSALVGTTCIDKFEASVWLVPDPTGKNRGLVKKLGAGKATAAALTAAGAVQIGCEPPPYSHAAIPAEYPANGNWTPIAGTKPPTPGVYAASVDGVLPSSCLTWFQAAQACALSGKRLASNEEWQRAAAGTPDPGATTTATSCNTNTLAPSPTGSRAECVSNYGVFDAVGNVWEWVADWTDDNEGVCAVGFLGDLSCFGGDGSTPIPGALRRGGGFADAEGAGPFAVSSVHDPVLTAIDFGFRCAR